MTLINCNIANLIDQRLLSEIKSNVRYEMWGGYNANNERIFNGIEKQLKILKSNGKNVRIEYVDSLHHYCKEILRFFNIEKAFIKTTYQPSGDMYKAHYDDFEAIKRILNTDKDLIRYYVFLSDQSHGQVFIYNDKYVWWNKGDVITWDETVLHGSANLSKLPKFGLTITTMRDR